MIKNLFKKVRPRIKFNDLTLIRLRIKSCVAARPHSPASSSPRLRTSKLSSSAPIHGAIFSSSVPGKKPISSPTGTVTRVMMISEYIFLSSTWVSADAKVSKVLPVPACPSKLTKSTSGSISKFSAKFCSRLRAVMPHTLCLACK